MIVNKYNQGGGGSSSAVTPQEVQQQIDSALTPYWESAETQSAITEAVSGLASEEYVQEALSGVNLENYYTSAQTEEAITSKNYVTSADVKTQVEAYNYMDQEDAEVISTSLNDLEDKIEVLSGRTVDLSGYYTSAQTDSAITMAVSGKADAANIEANGGLTWFPTWNRQGIIVGTAKRCYTPSITINGKVKEYIDARGNGNVPDIWAPQSAGTAGQILKSTGAVPEWITPATINGSAITAGGNIEIQAGGGITSADVKTQIEAYNYMDSTDAQVISTALNDLNTNKVAGSGITNIVKIEQSDYDALVAQSATSQTTLYVVVPDAQ